MALAAAGERRIVGDDGTLPTLAERGSAFG
jgi:hypothetical protein